MIFRRLFDTLIADILKIWKAGAIHISLSRYLTQFIGILQRILLARILGPANIGHIAVVKSLLELIQLPAGMGSYTAITKFIAESKDEKSEENKILSTTVIYNIFTSIFVMLIVYLLINYTNVINDQIAKKLLNYILFFLPFIVLTRVFTSFLAGQKRMQTIAKYNSLIPIFRITLVLLLAYFFLLLGWITAQIVIIIFGLLLFGRHLTGNISFTFDKRICKKLFTIGSWAFLGQAVGTILLQFDTLCISGILKNAEATGIYNTASLASQQMVALSGGILYTAFPYVAQNRDNINKLKKKYVELVKKLSLLNILLYLIVIFLAPYFFILFGNEFILSVSPFRILALSSIIFSLAILANTYLDALGRTDLQFISGIFAAFLNILLNFIFIPRFGINGAAWATIISMLVTLIIKNIFLFHFIFLKKKIK